MVSKREREAGLNNASGREQAKPANDVVGCRVLQQGRLNLG